jgi:phosphatidylglycerophosphate synthase
LWGLSSRQRLERVLKRAGVQDFIQNLESVTNHHAVLLIRGDFLYDERVINGLVEKVSVLLCTDSGKGKTPVAAHVPSNRVQAIYKVMIGEADEESLSEIKIESPETISTVYQTRLRKSDPPFVMAINAENRHSLERLLFSASYKGVTDLVTKWAWPYPAHWCTKVCAHLGLRPNHVTFIGFILVIAACILFYYGQFGWGLLAGWVMTFLDTVDGKLARVTVTSSKFGHLFDHVIDIVHPPVWYIIWGLGLDLNQAGILGVSLNALLWIIFGGYALGRFIEATFTLFLGKFGIFCWYPIDSYFRLITGRRNPNLILLTAATLAGRPDLGLFAVACWTGLSSFFLLLRLIMAALIRMTSGPLHSWMSDIDQGKYEGTLATKLFARR